MLICDISTLIFALQLINSKSSRPDSNFHKMHVDWREIISRIFFKIYHISTKYPAIIHTAETIEILRQFKPKLENGRVYAKHFDFEMLGF